MSVNIYHGTIYASCVGADDVIEGRAYVYKKVWTLATTYHLDFRASSATTKPVVTVSAKNNLLKFVSSGDTIMFVFGLSGRRRSAAWSFEKWRMFTGARICDDDFTGCLLLMTDDVSKFLLVEDLGMLKVQSLHSQVGRVHTAVFYSDHAYVVNDDMKSMCRFAMK